MKTLLLLLILLILRESDQRHYECPEAKDLCLSAFEQHVIRFVVDHII